MPEKKPISLGFLGDVMLARGVERHFRNTPGDFTMPDIVARLAHCDHVHANLESPISDVGVPNSKQDPNVCFRADPEMLNVLQRLGVSSVSLANNHVLDYGAAALERTREVLDVAKIDHLGAGENASDANAPFVSQIGAYKVGFVASNFIFSASTKTAGRHSPGAANYRLKKIIRSIQDVREQVDIVIVTVHWGLEYSFYPLPYIQHAARRFIDAGAQLVVGHGPHYVQPIERYGNGCIAYSLGNFIFDEPFRYSNISFALLVEMDGKQINNVDVHPVEIRNHVPRFIHGWQAERIKLFVERGASGFGKKSARFWQDLSNTYFSTMFHRAVTTRSIKYLVANPIRFYRGIGCKNYLRKLGIGRESGS